MSESLLEELRAAAKRKTLLKDRDLRGAKLAGAKLPYLRGDFARLDGADLSGADLSLAHFMDSDFVGADLTDASFAGATLWQCKLDEIRGERLRLDGLRGGSVWLRDADLRGATLTRAELEGSAFERARLDGAVLDGARAHEASFAGASMVGASLLGCALQRADLRDANLRDAKLMHADLTGADLRGANLDGASFGGAKLEGARFDGAPPSTSGGTPDGDPWKSLLAYIAAGDVAAVRALRAWWPPHWDRSMAAAAIDRPGDADARAALADVLLDDEDPFTRFCAVSSLTPELEVPRIVERLGAMLSATPIAPPKSPGVGPGRRDIGLAAAFALARRPGDADARAALEASLEGKADVQERCAAGLAFAAARASDLEAMDALFRSQRPRVRAGVCTGLIRFLERVLRQEEPEIDAVVALALKLVKRGAKDKAPVVQKAAKRHHVQLFSLLAKGGTRA